MDAAPPDLDKEPHLAISRHFKRFPDLDRVWHNDEERWYQLTEIETSIRIFDDRVLGWFLECARGLPHDGFVVLSVVIAYFEGSQYWHRGKVEGRSGELFKEALKRVFPDLPVEAAEVFWGKGRCGLFHNGMTGAEIRISNSLADAVVWKSQKLYVNPNKLLEEAISDHRKYVTSLLSGKDKEQRTRFRAVWEKRWPNTLDVS